MRRLALSVPQSAQRMYIVRANQAVMIALEPSIPISTTRFSSSSFKLCISPADSFDNFFRVRNHAGKLRRQHPCSRR